MSSPLSKRLFQTLIIVIGICMIRPAAASPISLILDCDNVIESPGIPTSADSCSTLCTGNASKSCGDSTAITIFQSNPTVPPPPAPPSIKKIVGSFNYMGCFTDAINGEPRSLINKTISARATAESCTDSCKSAGFILAGLEFGGECWCDNYMVRANPVPDSDCNSLCDGDPTELCGAGNRLAVYQDTSAPPLDAQTCLTPAQLHSLDDTIVDEFVYIFSFRMAFASGGGTPVPLGLVPNGDPVPVFDVGGEQTLDQNFTLSGRPFVPTKLTPLQPVTFELVDILLQPEQVTQNLPFPLVPIPNGPMKYEAIGFSIDFFEGYCGMPHPLSPFGTFIGPPVLGVTSGRSGFNFTGPNVWFSCQNGDGPLDPIFVASPPANVNCTSVFLEMVPL